MLLTSIILVLALIPCFRLDSSHDETITCSDIGIYLQHYLDTKSEIVNSSLVNATLSILQRANYPRSGCLSEIIPALYILRPMATGAISRLDSNLIEYGRRLSSYESDLKTLKDHIQNLNASLSKVLMSFGNTYYSPGMSNQYNDENIEDLEKNMRSVLGQLLALDSRTTDMIVLMASHQKIIADHENRIQSIEEGIMNNSYTDDTSSSDENSIMLDSSDRGATPGPKSSFTIGSCLGEDLTKLVFSTQSMKKSINKSDCAILKDISQTLVTAIIAIPLIVVILLSLLYLIIYKVVYIPIKETLLLSHPIHKAMAVAKKRGRLSELQQRMDKLSLKDLPGAQYTMKFDEVIQWASEGRDVYYVVAIMTMDLRKNRFFGILNWLLRSSRFNPDFHRYFLVLAYFDSYTVARNQLSGIYKMTINTSLEEIPHYEILNGWINLSTGRILDFLLRLKVFLGGIANKLRMNDGPIINLNDGHLSMEVLVKISEKESVDIGCEGILIFKNSKLHGAVVMCREGEGAGIPEVPSAMFQDVMNPDKTKKSRFFTRSAPDQSTSSV